MRLQEGVRAQIASAFRRRVLDELHLLRAHPGAALDDGTLLDGGVGRTHLLMAAHEAHREDLRVERE
eukprot:jgi/Chrpa1/10636/Chrysochromulina_OHIO_Genome00003142-RA